MAVILSDEPEVEASKVVTSAAYLEGRRAQREGQLLGSNPYTFRERDRWELYVLGFFDEAHGVSVETRARCEVIGASFEA